MKNLFFLLSIFIVFFFISGCRPSRVVVRNRPMEPHYIQPMAPGPNYIWHSGEWIRRRHTYVYHKGFWIKARSRRSYYNPGHWERRNAGWVWVSGRWR